MDVVWAIVALVSTVGAIGALMWVSASGHDDRDQEEAAREFFDVNGHWPDEEPPREFSPPRASEGT